MKARTLKMGFSSMFGGIALFLVAIVAAAAVYFVVTAIKGKLADRKEQQAYRDLKKRQ